MGGEGPGRVATRFQSQASLLPATRTAQAESILLQKDVGGNTEFALGLSVLLNKL